jgi:6-phosphofructokinase 1
LKLIAIATTGGDAPGMNAAIRAVVRTAMLKKLKVLGFKNGFVGLLNNDFRFLDAREVGGIMHLGGTFLRTSRSNEIKTNKGINKAVKVLTKNKVEGLIVIGGNGSFRAACRLYEASGIPVIGIPATIDNDLAGTDTTIGFDTAVNTALEAVDKIRDTATSHQRVFVIEVMGHNRGFIALEVGIDAGAEVILVPEIKYDINKICRKLEENYGKGKASGIIVTAEGAADCTEIVKSIKDKTEFEVRLTRLGHIQRGGHPTAYSRLLACKMGTASVNFLLNGRTKDMTGIQGNKIVPVDLEYASKVEKPLDEKLYNLALQLAK